MKMKGGLGWMINIRIEFTCLVKWNHFFVNTTGQLISLHMSLEEAM